MLGAVACFVANDALVKYASQSLPTAQLIFLRGAMATALVLAVAQASGASARIREGLRGWVLALASVFLAAGYYLIINSMRHGEMSLIAPFRYSGLLFAVVLGYTIWGDVPNLVAWCGIALLVGSGLYVLYHERQRVRRAAALEVS